MATVQTTTHRTDMKTTRSPSTHAWRNVLVALIAVLAAVFALLLPSHNDLHPLQSHTSLFSSHMAERSPLLDNSIFGAASPGAEPTYPFGRWKAPAENVAFHADAHGWMTDTFRTKMWHYSSFNTRDYFIGMAVVKLGYAHDAFLYVVDKTAPTSDKFEYTGSVGLAFATTSIDDNSCTRSQSPLSTEFLSFCYEPATSEWRIQVAATTVAASTGETRLFAADLRMKREEALALLFPLGNDTMRPAYVHKGAGSPVRGAFSFGAVTVDLTPSTAEPVVALGAIDWTRSLALRCTQWNWASASFRARVETRTRTGATAVATASVGINLSKDVYDIAGESQENAIWVNGRVVPLRGVRFTVPADPMHAPWRVESIDGLAHEVVDLTFTPRGSREDHTHLLVMTSDFVQPYGTFSGRIEFTADNGDVVRVEVDDAFGVVEQHYAVW